jgi:hypothetical protein
MAETGKKMGDYTPLESNKKEYFLGDGEGSVVAVGKTDAAGEKTNRLVKLSDIVGDKLPATTSSDAGKALHVGSDGVPVFKFAELRQMPDVVQQSASDNGHIFTNNTYTKVILKYNTDQDLYSPQVKLASDELPNCIIDIYIDSTYNLDGHDLFIMFDIQRNGESLKQIARPLTGDHFRHLEKGSYIRIHALGDSWSAQVGIPWNTPGWLPCQLVPAAEVGDKGKMLQVLDRDGNLGWGVGIPAPANDDVGKVLTVSTSESHLVATWEEASGGGGGAAYTKVTKTASYNSGNSTMTTSVDNNAYNVVSTAINQSATDLEISLAQTDLPDTFVEIKTNPSGYTSNLTSIKVYNGSTQLKRILPAGVLQGHDVWSKVASTEYGDATAWREVFGAQETILVRIQGNTFIIYFTGSTMEAYKDLSL